MYQLHTDDDNGATIPHQNSSFMLDISTLIVLMTRCRSFRDFFLVAVDKVDEAEEDKDEQVAVLG